jgi:hypothetical protein
LATPVLAQRKITTPKKHFGFTPGDDYYLANYTQFMAYLKKLSLESKRLSLAGIGITSEEHPMYMAIITSPENQRKINRYKDISKRLAMAEGLTDSEARELASEGRAVVWIDGGLHGTEVLGAQQLIELVYQMASQNDPETLRILNDVILLVVCSNPDGMELVSDWYMREKEPTKRSMRGRGFLKSFTTSINLVLQEQFYLLLRSAIRSTTIMIPLFLWESSSSELPCTAVSLLKAKQGLQ